MQQVSLPFKDSIFPQGFQAISGEINRFVIFPADTVRFCFPHPDTLCYALLSSGIPPVFLHLFSCNFFLQFGIDKQRFPWYSKSVKQSRAILPSPAAAANGSTLPR